MPGCRTHRLLPRTARRRVALLPGHALERALRPLAQSVRCLRARRRKRGGPLRREQVRLAHVPGQTRGADWRRARASLDRSTESRAKGYNYTIVIVHVLVLVLVRS